MALWQDQEDEVGMAIQKDIDALVKWVAERVAANEVAATLIVKHK